MGDTYRRSANDEELFKFDQFAHAVTTIDEPHRMAHDGFMYHASGKVTGMIDANVDEFLLTTQAFNFPHLQRLNFDFGAGDIDIQSYEGATASADGTVIGSNNTNRNSANTADLVMTSGPTLTGDGTLIHTTWAHPVGTGIGQSAQGISDVTNGEEWILKPSTKYLIRITNNSGATISYRYEVLFYELGYSTSETKNYG